MSGLGELDRPGAADAPEAPSDANPARYGPAPDGPFPDGTSPYDPPPHGPASEGSASDGRGPGVTRRGAADPVKALMHRHRALCERAVDPLEIAAGLEAHGVTDRTAARFRHRDVFSLAEEMYARVPRDGDTPPPPAPAAPARPRADWALLTLLPGVLCAATLTGMRLTDGRTCLLVTAAGLLAVALAVHATLRRGPLSGYRRAHPRSQRTEAWTCWLIGYTALGDGLLRAAVHGGPDALPDGTTGGPWPFAAARLLTLTLACAPAAWSAHFLTAQARRRLHSSRGLEEFAAGVQPLLLAALALFLGALTALTALGATALGEPADYAPVLTLGALLFLARLLTVHGFAHAPAVVVAAAGAAEVLAPATVFAGRLPGCGFLATPVESLLAAWGPAGVPSAVCASGALILLIHATRTLTRASAHARTDQPC
ncbi:hypothetical protein OG802_23490 [Streptomyces sp. NBC_00704]|uniref:hypothetical protein n=1 Tax=Streptomyces sp. NBC_00704 TaxID=2975809 RepID=UPI002E34D922|nr:hypothetical protein [Streptomyces sp. NBC_00704]